MTFKVSFGTYVFLMFVTLKSCFVKQVVRIGYLCSLFNSIRRYNIGLKFTKFQPSRATMTISNRNSFDLFSYGSESVFWYFQFQRLISNFSDNPLKLSKISCRGIQFFSNRHLSAIFQKNGNLSVLV